MTWYNACIPFVNLFPLLWIADWSRFELFRTFQTFKAWNKSKIAWQTLPTSDCKKPCSKRILQSSSEALGGIFELPSVLDMLSSLPPIISYFASDMRSIFTPTYHSILWLKSLPDLLPFGSRSELKTRSLFWIEIDGRDNCSAAETYLNEASICGEIVLCAIF